MNDKDFKLMRESYRQKPATTQEVKGVRKALHLTQVGFASVVGESPSAVEHWEQGIRRPSGSASRLIRILKSHPDLVSELREDLPTSG
jgi:putative transcriptional regulator